MSQPSCGAFLPSSVSSTDIISFLEKKYTFHAELAGASSLCLEGICDSRSGGHRQLVFSTQEHYAAANTLTESLVLND